eukprot:CAMPEP_0169093550 /NCGR_PEP_ID=MMETSP1015-20121227/17493_1 /TAXON_ID=342587 /ORGANISM="Karlodinium micrum, Strain CCMP2283" /LENGTH=394 /DNA_ID=CAMNT_0009154191 /DNA_START=200 /DNA_END=1384 /DNA_ORIENTATION=-
MSTSQRSAMWGTYNTLNFVESVYVDSLQGNLVESIEINSSEIEDQMKLTVGGKTYKKLRALGSGTFGEVWLCIDEEDSREVAIKVPKTTKFADIISAEAKREISNMEAFSGNHRAVHMLNHDPLTEEFPRIVMEYTAYGSLEGQLGRHISTMIQRIACAYQLMLDAALASVAMQVELSEGGLDEHEVMMTHITNKFAHGDLKPDNMLVFVHDGKVLFKTADWGGAFNVTQEQEPKGTPCYMAPEVFKSYGLKKSHKADAWAIAISVLALLVDEKGFDPCRVLSLSGKPCSSMQQIGAVNDAWATLTEEAMIKHLKGRVDQLANPGPSVGAMAKLFSAEHPLFDIDPTPLFTILARMLKYDPDQRYDWQQVGMTVGDLANKYADKCPPSLFLAAS